MRRGIRFISLLEPSGYAMAALAHLRGLVNAGIAVEWRVAQRVEGSAALRLTSVDSLPAFAEGDAALADLPALIDATSLPLACDRVVVFAVPEHWPRLFEAGRVNIGCTAWETDRLPAHWRGLLDGADRVIVPCLQNRDVINAAGVRAPVFVVPHVRRHIWNAFSGDELEQMRDEFGLGGVATLFYSINAWDPRKNLATLLRGFVRAFTLDEPVALLLKTDPLGFGAPPEYRREPAEALARAVIEAESHALGRAPPRITILPYTLSGRAIDALHRIGDAYVSTAHGEAFGLGAFDAATLGRPVLMTGWGGQRDYLGDDAAWPGALPYRMTSVPVFPPDAPSYWRSQRWADVEADVVARSLRAYCDDPAPHLDAAARIAERIANEFAEPRVAARMAEAIFADVG